ncbi:MAG: helix-hairpin-helix domain-containing protein [bacterium]
MPTPSEKKALAFVAIVILLGGAFRVVRAGSPTGPTVFEQQAITRQATAADSAASAAHSGKSGKKSRATRGSARRDTLPVVIGGVASVPPTFARPDQPNAHAPYGSSTDARGFPPPSPRVDSDFRGYRATPTPSVNVPSATIKKGRPGDSDGVTGGAAKPMDLDTASEADIERLPGIGPAIAKRLIADRGSRGAFASLGGLGRVKGMGPATLRKLAPLVTFSGLTAPRP